VQKTGTKRCKIWQNDRHIGNHIGKKTDKDAEIAVNLPNMAHLFARWLRRPEPFPCNTGKMAESGRQI
jgi:hypothetical protein